MTADGLRPAADQPRLMSWGIVSAAAGMWVATALELLVVVNFGAIRLWAVLFFLAPSTMVIWFTYLRHRILSHRMTAYLAILIGSLVITAMSAIVVTWRVIPLQVDPFAVSASEHPRIEADLVLNSVPEHRSGRASGSRRMDDTWRARATVLAWRRVGNGRVETNLPVELDVEKLCDGMIPGAFVHVEGSTRPGDPSRATAAYVRAETIRLVQPAPLWQRLASMFRDSVTESVRSQSPDVRGLLPGLVVGDTRRMSDDLSMAMRDSGLSHLSAVSGGNISIVIIVWLATLRAAGLRRGRQQLIAVALGVLAYVVVVQPQPSVDRAAVMALAVLAAESMGRQLKTEAVLSATVFVLVLIDPFLALSPGFAMSVLATAALIYVARRRMRSTTDATALRRAVVGIATLAMAAFAATMVVAPVSVWFGNGLQLGGLIANVVAEPCVFPATAFGLIAGCIGLVNPHLATIVVLPGAWATWCIAAVARWTAATFPPSPWQSGLAGAGLMLALLLVGVGAFWLAPSRLIRRLCGAVVAIGLLLTLGVPTPVAQPLSVATSWPPPGWQLIMCDVGQGDSTLIRVNDTSAIAVDVGPDPAAEKRCLQRAGITHIPIVVLTHFHADHVEGLPGLLSFVQPELVEVSPLPEPASERRRVIGWLSDADRVARSAAPGDNFHVGPVSLEVVWPQRILRGLGSDPNNSSVTLLANVNGIKVLLGGDLETAAQQALLASGRVSAVDVVKVPHHGSAKQSVDWVGVTRPKIALIGVGRDNDYGHPWPGTVRAYEVAGVVVGRTDTDGDLAVVRADDGVLQLIRRGKWG